MNSNRKSVAVAFAWALSAGLSATAQAHEDDSAAGQSEPAQDVRTLETVIATAQKRSENIMEVPGGISVIGEARLESLGAGQLTDFAAYVPGFQVDSGGAPGQTSLSLRGVAPLGSSAIIGTYIDDTPLGSSSQHQRASSFVLDLLPYDVESVEVLRGPQGTLYGASSMGGLFKYITKSADPNQFEGRFGAGINTVSQASDIGKVVNAAINAPLLEDRLGMRVSFARKTTPGYIDNDAIGERDYNDHEQLASRLALFWRLSDNATLQLQGLWQKVDSSNVAAVALDPDTMEPLLGNYASNSLMPEPYRNELNYYSATLDWDVGWADFVSATSYSRTVMSQFQDVSAMYGTLYPLFGYPEGQADFSLLQGLKKWTQELRLSSKASDRFEWLVGAFFTDEDASNAQTAFAYDTLGEAVAGLNPLAVASLPNTFEEQALFGDATWKFGPRFDVSLGARVSRNQQVYRQISTGLLLPDADASGHSSETVSTYKLSSRWHAGDDAMVYARVATGFRPGGPNALLPDVPSKVDADTSTNYEVGIKSRFLSGRALLDVAAFQIDWEDMQVNALSPNGITYLANGGGARSRGVEISSLFRPAGGLTLGLNAAWIDAHLDEDVPASSGLEPGSRMPLTPEWSWSATLDYNLPLHGNWSANVGGGYRNVGERVGTHGFTMGSYRSIDLHADISNLNWTVRLFARNAGDERAYASVLPIVNALTGEASYLQGVLLQPRIIGIAVDYRY